MPTGKSLTRLDPTRDIRTPADPIQPDPIGLDPTRPDPTRPDPTRPDPTRPDPTRPDPTRPDPTRPDPTRPARFLETSLHDPRDGSPGYLFFVHSLQTCPAQFVEGAATGALLLTNGGATGSGKTVSLRAKQKMMEEDDKIFSRLRLTGTEVLLQVSNAFLLPNPWAFFDYFFFYRDVTTPCDGVPRWLPLNQSGGSSPGLEPPSNRRRETSLVQNYT